MDKILYSITAVCIAGLALLAFPLASALSGESADTYFVQNLLPELLSICVDGLLFVGVLTLVQRTAERREVKRLRDAVLTELEFLKDVMMNCLYQSELGLRRDTQIDFSSPKHLAETMRKLHMDAQARRSADKAGNYTNDEFSLLAKSVSDAVLTKAKVHLRRLEALTPVTAQFGNEFLSNWLSLNDQLFSLTREEEFEKSQIDVWGSNMPFEYYYDRVVDLFRYLDALHV